MSHIGYISHVTKNIVEGSKTIMSFYMSIVYNIHCNDLKLELRLHLGKDLRKYKG